MRTSIFPLFCLGMAFLSCTKQSDVILFRMNFDQVIQVPGGLNTVETYSFLLRDLQTNYKNYLSANNLKDSDVRAIKCGSILISDDIGLFSFGNVEKTSILFSKDGFNTEKEIAYHDIIPFSTGSSLQLIPDLTDIKDIMSGDKFGFIWKLKLRGFLTAASNMRFRMVLVAVQ